jgi:hypothetical protein
MRLRKPVIETLSLGLFTHFPPTQYRAKTVPAMGERLFLISRQAWQKKRFKWVIVLRRS